MKKPWVIGLLSIIPGLGLLVLGQIVPGLVVMAGTALLIYWSRVSSSADLTAWIVVLGLIFWMLQLGYAIVAAMLARSPKRSAARTARRQAQELQRESAAIQLAARQALAPLLRPGQTLRIALLGLGGMDARLWGDLLLAIVQGIGGGAVTESSDRPTTCIGITADELVFTTTRRSPKPSDLRQVPLSDVSLAGFKEGRLGFDRLTLQIGKRQPLRLYTAKCLRTTIQELADILRK